MAVEDTVKRFQDLSTAVGAWATVEKTRLQAQSSFLKVLSLRASAEKIASVNTTKASQQALGDAQDFLKT